MSKTSIFLSSSVLVSKLDTTDYARVLWSEAFAMARRMVRARPGRSAGDSLTWFFDQGFRRFGYTAMPIIHAAGWAVLDRIHVTKAATGTREELARQGMLTRAVRLEPAPRGGFSWAWTHDELAAVNLRRSYRVHRARQLREERVRRRAVARAMAEERRRMLAEVEADDRLYVLTEAGEAVLAAAGMLDG